MILPQYGTNPTQELFFISSNIKKDNVPSASGEFPLFFSYEGFFFLFKPGPLRKFRAPSEDHLISLSSSILIGSLSIPFLSTPQGPPLCGDPRQPAPKGLIWIFLFRFSISGTGERQMSYFQLGV